MVQLIRSRTVPVAVAVISLMAAAATLGPRGVAQEATPAVDPADPAASIGITVDEAVAAAESAVGGAASNVQLAFAVSFDGEVVFVDAADGRIMDIGPEPQPMTPAAAGFTVSEGKRHLSRAGITPDQAVEAALTVAEGNVRNIELDWDNGRLLYEVTIGRVEVYVDAQTGAVVEIERPFSLWR